jgi:hypothetical protein
MGNAELSFEEVEGGTHLVELNLVMFANGSQNVDLDQVGEGEQTGRLENCD